VLELLRPVCTADAADALPERVRVLLTALAVRLAADRCASQNNTT
jgi:hypothetical protein